MKFRIACRSVPVGGTHPRAGELDTSHFRRLTSRTLLARWITDRSAAAHSQSGCCKLDGIAGIYVVAQCRCMYLESNYVIDF